MKLLTEKELVWSDVVANNRMNRKRNASGVNSYEQELHFKPEEYLNSRLQQNKKVKWLDLCCGEGNALLQYAKELAEKGWQEHAILKGIDLVDHFSLVPAGIHCVRLEVQSLTDWQPNDQYDLITCVHGLHYIGDKLQLLTQILKAIAHDGLFVANLDWHNIKVEGDPNHKQVKQLFGENTIEYNSRKKLLTCKGPRNIKAPFVYQGADDKAGPNYTGQPVVNSYYTSYQNS